jgi:uracil-DNA glycosylase family 4
MEGRCRVLGHANGPLQATVLFVAEAPGRLGSDRTGVPLTSDQSGRNFALLLRSIGWSRDDVFVSNAVLCNPRDGRGRNDTPTMAEVRACSSHLRDLLEILDPPIVAALGRTALAALSLIALHQAELRRDVATAVTWHGRVLVPLYHPGPRAQLHRTPGQQLEDFACLRAIVERPGA